MALQFSPLTAGSRHVLPTAAKTTRASAATAKSALQASDAAQSAAGAASTGDTQSTGNSQAPDIRALFSGVPTPVSTTATPAADTTPTAESAFGSSPWVANPTGSGPDGLSYSYNPIYFASASTAAEVAQMVGGKVVSSNQITAAGSPFTQQQPNLMVQLANGALINPGLVASFYTHGYPQSTIDQMIAAEARNTPA